MFIATNGIGQQKGYGKIDLGVNFFSSIKPSASLTIGFKPAPNTGFGAKVGYIQDLGLLLLGEFRGFSTIKKSMLSVALNAGTRIKNDVSTLAFGADASLIFGKPFISIGGLFLKEKTAVKYNAFYIGKKVTDLQ